MQQIETLHFFESISGTYEDRKEMMHWGDEKNNGALYALSDLLTRPQSCLSGPCPILSLCHSDVDGFSAGGCCFLPTYKSPLPRRSMASKPEIGFILQCSFKDR